MGFTSRKKRPLDRTIPHLIDTRLIIIATEGEKTEKCYFQAKAFSNLRVQIRVLPTEEGMSAPKHVLDRLKHFADTTELAKDDQLWLVVDKDRWPDLGLKEVCSQAIRRKKTRVQLAVSNPCFELWLYLHLDKWGEGAIGSQECLEKLRSIVPGYEKSQLNMDRFQDNIDTATENAKALDFNPRARWPENPGTHVYKLVESILQLIRQETS